MSLAGRVGRGGLRGLAWALLPLVALAAHGCAPAAAPPFPPQAPPAARSTAHPRPKPGYDRRIDALAAADTAALRGRRIALDPGHGGFFRGALGVGGLTEAEVNLGVALHLRGLLEARGALVFMTRTDDRDFLTPADSSLRSDLAERTSLAQAFRPELFVSVHHNADARGTHDVNETQTYYKLGDEGPSLDAAQSLHRYLVRNLGIERQRILPGNYFVLRNSEAPAILTEASYITNPDVESKLALAAKQRLEAEALYLGVAHYFSRPRPVIEELAARAGPGEPPDSVFGGVAAPVVTGRIAGAFDSFELRLDGEPLPAVRQGGEITARPGPLASGPHAVALRARLAGSGAALERRLSFTIRREPKSVRFSPLGLTAGREGGLVPVRLEVLDAVGELVRDSVAVRLEAGSRGVSPRDTTTVARDGVAWAYFRVTHGVGPASVTARLAARAGGARAGAGVARSTIADPAARRDPKVALGFALRMPEEAPLTGAPGTREPRAPDAWLNRDGFAVVPRDSAGRPSPPPLPGYRPFASDVPWPPRFVAVGGGALHGMRIVLDPDGGGENDAGTGSSGTRAANLNLEVARSLAGFLRAAGADVRLTRSGDFALSDVERVQMSEVFRADRFVRIGHRPEPPMAGYYFTSAPGRRWAERTARMLEAFGLAPPAVAEDAQYVIQQTSCPGIYVSAARVDDPASEERLASPAAIRAEAYALYLGLLGDASGADPAIDSLTVMDGDAPVRGAAVWLGGILLLSDADGRVRFARTEAGPLEVLVEHPRVRARRVLLDSTTGVTVTGSRGP